MLPEETLKDRVAIITGGGTGLGKAMAHEFSRLGAIVVLCSRNAEHLNETSEEIRVSGGEALPVVMDVRIPDQIDDMVNKVKKTYDRFDILVNNAAATFICPAEDLSINGWNVAINVHLNGTFYVTRAVGREMIASGRGGRILNNVATLAWTGNPGTVHAAAAKAGVIAMTRTLAVEWARYNIRVNAIAPGPIMTQGASERLFPEQADHDYLMKRIPLRRLGRPEEIAWAASFLVSDFADFVNGEVFTVDGGEWLSKGMFRFLPEDQDA